MNKKSTIFSKNENAYDILNDFDKIKIFKKFLPHNNFDKIMHVENIKNKKKKIQKMTA